MDKPIDLNNRIALITGATDGIGKITAEALVHMGAQVIITGRNPQKTEAVAKELSQAGNRPVDFLTGDLSSQEEVRKLADEFKTRYGHLDILVNNAGAVFMKRQISADGLEMTFALNHLGYFLLTLLLLDRLSAGSRARIVNVSSAAHMGGTIHFDDLQGERGYSGWKAYSQSKLANILFTYELARRLEGSRVTANALHPGFVATNFGKSNGGLFRPLFGLFQVAAITPVEGAATSIYLASSPEVEGVSGKYFDRMQPVKSSSASYDAAAARKLWEISLQLAHLPEMMRI
ncbi:MAG TPA: SDR family oxidoreductase [Anaerolinea sp.]|nr:SDR family oxidoreductase [Anaerolinea sp.]